MPKWNVIGYFLTTIVVGFLIYAAGQYGYYKAAYEMCSTKQVSK